MTLILILAYIYKHSYSGFFNIEQVTNFHVQ
jgi:hypothetical protein